MRIRVEKLIRTMFLQAIRRSRVQVRFSTRIHKRKKQRRDFANNRKTLVKWIGLGFCLFSDDTGSKNITLRQNYLPAKCHSNILPVRKRDDARSMKVIDSKAILG